METLPLKVQELFRSCLAPSKYEYELIKRVHDKDANVTYFIREFKDEPEVSFIDFLNEKFIPDHPYDNPGVLRTDFDDTARNYVSTACASYSYRYLKDREIHQEILNHNPREDGRVHVDIEI